MKKWTRYMLLMPVLMVQALSSCSLIDEPEYDETGNVDVSLAFTVSSATSGSTRMANAVVQEQENGRSYRGLGDVYMIPFAISGTQVTSSDHPSRLLQDASLLDSRDPQEGNYGGFYLYNVYTLVRGINAFLVYARAKEIDGVTGKVNYGSLQVPDLTYPDLTTLRFSLEPFYKSTTVPATAPTEATLLAGYLNYIANAPDWSTAEDPTLKLLYKLFTGQENDGTMIMAGASVNVKEHVNALYKQVSSFTFTGSNAIIQSNILERIKNYPNDGLTLTSNNEEDPDWRLTAVKVNGKDYPDPVSLGLPDGAAALRWVKKPDPSTEYEFKPQTETTTLDNINNISRFCYPPELFYYANSRIDTSNDEDFQSLYASNKTATKWDGENGVLEKYENKNAYVSGNTKGIAIKKPLQYAVGRLKITLQGVTTEALKDDAGKEIPLIVNSQPSFPLTGVLICNQHSVGFDFQPVGVETHTDDCFIYDSQVGTGCYLRQKDGENDSGTSILSTLVLQTYQDEEVTIALEFLNDSGTDFRGKGGVIYPGTKFYLMGRIKPGDTNVTVGADVPEYVTQRVFTRDYVTTVSTKVESLANAYNVLPNILGGRLELGVTLTPDWIQAETTNVLLNEDD